MIDKVGRNAPCPCGSGKKYKRCCLQKSEKRVIRPTFSEETAVGTLLRSSERFGSFFRAERAKITKPLLWELDGSLPAGIPAISEQLPSGEQVIRLSRIPATLDDEFTVAHEVEHLVLYTEGFSLVRSLPQYVRLSWALNAMLHDPIVDDRLAEFGYTDRAGEYEREIEEARHQLSNLTEPTERLERAGWIINYVSNLLDWEKAYPNTDPSENEFKRWFDRRYPSIAVEGEELLRLVRDVGYDTPLKMARLLAQIVRKLRLQKILEPFNPSSATLSR